MNEATVNEGFYTYAYNRSQYNSSYKSTNFEAHQMFVLALFCFMLFFMWSVSNLIIILFYFFYEYILISTNQNFVSLFGEFYGKLPIWNLLVPLKIFLSFEGIVDKQLYFFQLAVWFFCFDFNIISSFILWLKVYGLYDCSILGYLV